MYDETKLVPTDNPTPTVKNVPKTGEKQRRDAKEDNVFDTQFRELRRLIINKLDAHFDQTRTAREAIFKKFEKIDSKINTMLELQNAVRNLKRDLSVAENSLTDIQEKVDKMDVFSESSCSTLLYIPPTGKTSQNVFSSTFA